MVLSEYILLVSGLQPPFNLGLLLQPLPVDFPALLKVLLLMFKAYSPSLVIREREMGSSKK